ncbi:MAG TPA: ABC transporter ATP-binding protein [Gemmatimonadaceae bacterium]|nr:ABC transporter ATP-binding protein [Gemmatimonadaceae bacterium]
MTAIDKRFGAVQANRRASLEVPHGEIHALVGENGAGKSTLMRILGGLMKPDAGTVEVNGRDVTNWSTQHAIRAGIGVVHQHFMLVPPLTVAENVVLGKEPHSGLAFDRARALSDVAELERRTGLTVGGDRRVADLSVGEAQRVEILKTLYRGADILVLDEPTAVLSPPEVRDLWNVLRTVRDQGGTIILITHRLDEVMDLSEAITVMRAGETVARLRTSETSPAGIAHAMVGRTVALTEAVGFLPEEQTTAGLEAGAGAGPPAEAPARAAAALIVRDLVVPGGRGTNAVDGVSLEIAPGEILGIAGVEGNGQTELIEAIAGLRAVRSGSIHFHGTELTHASVEHRRAAGLAHVPEDRHRRGLILDYSVADNLILGSQRQFSGRASLDDDRIQAYAGELTREFDIRPPQPKLAARLLSGGNQQKVVIAREMGGEFTVLLASQPTRGVDVGAIEFIHQRLRDARDGGRSILLVSAELNEVLALADRIAVMYRGRIAAVLPARRADPELIGEYMIGARTGAA